MTQSPPTWAPPLPPLRTSRMAIWGLGCSVLSFCTCGLSGIAGLILGIVSLVKINRPENALTGRGLAIAAIVVAGLSLLFIPVQAGIMMPALVSARNSARSEKASAQLSQLGMAYMSWRASGAATSIELWPDELVDLNFVMPQMLLYPGWEGDGRAFALNRDVAEAETVAAPATTVLMFECAAGSPAVGGAELMPPRPRGLGYLILFADGSTGLVGEDEMSSIRWTP